MLLAQYYLYVFKEKAACYRRIFGAYIIYVTPRSYYNLPARTKKIYPDRVPIILNTYIAKGGSTVVLKADNGGGYTMSLR